MVSCQAADGRPSFYLVRIRCTQEEYDDGVHYQAAKEACDEQGYTNIGLVYDEYDGPAWLHKWFDWSSVDVRSVAGDCPATSRGVQPGPFSLRGRGDHRADLMLPNGQVTIDDALRVLAQAKVQIGGDKCLLLCLATSELEDVDVNELSIVDDRPTGGESTYVQVLVAHPVLVRETWRKYRGRYRLVAGTATYAQGERVVLAVDEQTARSAVVDWVNGHDPRADARIDYIVVVDSVEPCEEEQSEPYLYRLLLEAAGSTGKFIPEEIKDQLDQIATAIQESGPVGNDDNESCDECGAGIPATPGGSLPNKHHHTSCSLYNSRQP